MGYYWQRLIAKCANIFAATKQATYFVPMQLGVGVGSRRAAAFHTCRRYLDAHA